MAARDFFRTGDRVTVHGLILAEGRIVKGRVICTNRKSRYDMPIIVLVDLGREEMPESFKEDGSRYMGDCRITLGWKGGESK